MKTNHLSLCVAAALAFALIPASAAFAQASPQSMPTPGVVTGGTAPIDQALPRIIPPPYRIALDQSVPASVQLVWQSGSNWMDVLRNAVAPLGLSVIPNWNTNTILIVKPAVATVPPPSSEVMPAAVPPPIPVTPPAPMPAPAPVVRASAVSTAVPAPAHQPTSLPGGGCETTAAHARWGCIVNPPAHQTAAVAPQPPPIPIRASTATTIGTNGDVHHGQTTIAAPYTLKAGMLLSRALGEYTKKNGWDLKWNVQPDFVLEAPFPIPSGDDVIAGVSYVIRTYKAQGALLGATLVFAKPNHVVALLPTSAAMPKEAQ